MSATIIFETCWKILSKSKDASFEQILSEVKQLAQVPMQSGPRPDDCFCTTVLEKYKNSQLQSQSKSEAFHWETLTVAFRETSMKGITKQEFVKSFLFCARQYFMSTMSNWTYHVPLDKFPCKDYRIILVGYGHIKAFPCISCASSSSNEPRNPFCAIESKKMIKALDIDTHRLANEVGLDNYPHTFFIHGGECCFKEQPRFKKNNPEYFAHAGVDLCSSCASARDKKFMFLKCDLKGEYHREIFFKVVNHLKNHDQVCKKYPNTISPRFGVDHVHTSECVFSTDCSQGQ